MKKINCLIVDDEPWARKGLESFIDKTPFLNCSSSLSSANEALNYLKANSIDLMLLDIQMPGITGLDLMNMLTDPPKVIFTTAHREFALEGFELNAIDYLLKPISYDRFLKAVKKIVNNDVKSVDKKKHIFIKSDGVIVKVLLTEVLYIESANNYIIIHTIHKDYITLLSLKQIEEILPEEEFIRVHRSCIVNVEKVEKIEGNLLYIQESKIEVSRRLKMSVYNKIVGNRLIER